MAIRTSDRVTLAVVANPTAIKTWYLKQASNLAAPAKPTAATPPAPWTATEPAYTAGSTDTLYTVTETEYGTSVWVYSDVQKSSSFEAAKQAYNLANNVTGVVNGWTTTGQTTIDGGKITTDSITGGKILAGSIGTAHMTANTINGDRILANSLNASKIVANSITSREIQANSITANEITTGYLVGLKISAGDITGTTITGGTITGTAMNSVTYTNEQGITVQNNASGPDTSLRIQEYGIQVDTTYTNGTTNYLIGGMGYADVAGVGRITLYTNRVGGSMRSFVVGGTAPDGTTAHQAHVDGSFYAVDYKGARVEVVGHVLAPNLPVKVQTGNLDTTGSGTLAAHSGRAYTLTFPQPFANPPLVIANAQGNAMLVNVHTTTTTQVTLYMYNAHTAGINPTNIRWVAIDM